MRNIIYMATAAAVAFVLLNGCESAKQTAGATSGSAVKWKEISPKEGDIVFLADELDMELKYMRYRSMLEIYRDLEWAQWTAPGGRYPRLNLRLQSLHPGYWFPKDMTPIRNIIKRNRYVQDLGVEYGKKGVVVNALGRAKYETFRSGDLYCFLLRLGFGEAWEGDNKILSGYYCDRTPLGNWPDRIEVVLKRIGVKGEGVP